MTLAPEAAKTLTRSRRPAVFVSIVREIQAAFEAAAFTGCPSVMAKHSPYSTNLNLSIDVSKYPGKPRSYRSFRV